MGSALTPEMQAGLIPVAARFLFEADGVLREDPATGSACANLGEIALEQ